MRGDFCKKVAANDMPSAATWVVLTKKIPAENENLGFRRDSFSFLQHIFLIFSFWMTNSIREGNPEKVT